MLHSKFRAALALSFLMALASAQAEEHQHEGDIQPWLSEGQVQTNSTLFEADFGDLAGGAYQTDDPGYDVATDMGAFGAGNWLRYEGVGTLKFWDGSEWIGSVLNDEVIHIEDALGNISIFSTTGITDPIGVIGAMDSSGGLHEHIDMSIWDGTGNLGGSVGAYWISLNLFDSLPNDENPISLASETLNLIFNLGLPEESFEAAVHASVVPVPAAVYFFVSSLFGLGLINSRRKQAS